jgi:hypothetical protein
MPTPFGDMTLDMTILQARVENRRIVIDEPIDLPDGTTFEIAILDEDLFPEERKGEGSISSEA